MVILLDNDITDGNLAEANQLDHLAIDQLDTCMDIVEVLKITINK